jgi:peroxiredoxin
MRSVILSLLFFCTGISVYAQKTAYTFNENSIVKDSSGMVYPAAIWKQLLSKGYSIKAVDPKNRETEFIIYKLTDEQIEQRYALWGKPKESSYFKTGEKFSSFKTTDMDGNKIDIKNLEGKIIVLNFWFINCSPCRKEIPDLNNLVDSFKTNDKVVFIAVCLDDKASIQDFLKGMPFNYSIIDNGRFIASQYRIVSYPTHVIVDQQRRVYFHTSGLGSNTIYWIRKSIRELLAKEEDKTAFVNKTAAAKQ